MILIVRGIIWYGLYLFLIILPIATATLAAPERTSQSFLIQIAVGAGFIGFAIMALEFALISRIEAAAQPFGEDSVQLFHNLMGIVALSFILAHPILLVIGGYPANCWINPFSSCANMATRTAAASVIVLLLLVALSLWRKRLKIRYEPWQFTHGVFALIVVFTALIHMFILGRYTSTPEMKLIWLLYAMLVVGLIGWYKIWTPLKNWSRHWEIVENREERGDSRTLVLKPVGHSGFSFQSGQFAWIKSGKVPFGSGQHPISISSDGDIAEGESISFTVKNLGDWSGSEVPNLKPGDRMWVDGPYGVFTMEREQAMGYVFVAGGVGITPLYAMLQTMASREDVRPAFMFYGASDLESMTFKEELEQLAEKINLQLIPVLSHPDENWSGETGYVSAEIMKKYLPRQYKWFKYLICGPKPLMDAMETALPELGVPPHSVLTERFDMI